MILVWPCGQSGAIVNTGNLESVYLHEKAGRDGRNTKKEIKMTARRMTLILAAAALCGCLCVPDAHAGKRKFRRVAELEAGGGVKEIAVDRDAAYCMIRVMDGTVIINTIVVREGSKTTPHTVAAKLNKGDKKVVDIGPRRRITGLRISDDGRGKYRIYLKR
jgi:hypothetical protein